MGLFNNIIYILKGHDAQGEITALKSELAVSKQKERKALEDKNTAEVASRNLNNQLSAETKAKQEYLNRAHALQTQLDKAISNSKEVEKEWKVKYSTLEKNFQELTKANKQLSNELFKALKSSYTPTSSEEKEEEPNKDALGETAGATTDNTTDKQTDNKVGNKAESTSKATSDEQTNVQPTEDAETDSFVKHNKGEKTKDNENDYEVTSHVIKSKVDEAIKLSNGEIEDFPEIYNDSRQNSNRTIRYVFDNNYHVINAKQFFETSKPEDIAKASRDLANAYNDHRLLWYCPHCHQAVKIAHWKNSLFFIHAEKQGDCIWRNPSQNSKEQREENVQSTIEYSIHVLTSVDTKYQELKNRIYAALTTSKSRKSISDVRIDSPIHDKVDYKKWNRADISFNYKGKLWVIELQHKGQGTSYIAEKDKFYFSNGIQTLWIFGSDSDTSYDYLNTLNYKTTLFDSHRNAFVFDKQAQSETSALGELRFKCNWLDGNDEWHYTIKKDGTNGETIGLDDLIIDDIHCKPYFFENKQEDVKDEVKVSEQNNIPISNSEGDAGKKSDGKEIEANTDTNDKGKIEEITRDSKDESSLNISDRQIQNNDEKQNREAKPFAQNGSWGFKSGNVILIEPTFTVRPKTTFNGYYQVCKNGNIGIVDKYGKKIVDWNGIIPCKDMDYDGVYGRILFNRNGKWGVADKEGNILIEPTYDEIKPWNYEVYKVKQHNLLGLCNIHNELMLECKYSYIGELNEEGKASVQRTHPFDHKSYVRGPIGNDGKPITTLSDEQPDGNIAIMQIGLWGLQDKNEKTIIPCQYDSIEYLAPKLYLVSVGKKWGIFKTDDGALIYKDAYNKLSELKDGQVTVLQTDSKVNNASVQGNIIQNALNWPLRNKGKHPMQQIQVYGAVRKRIKFHGRVVQLWVALLDNDEQIMVSEDSFVDPLPKINSFHVGDKIHLIMNVDKNGKKYISRVIK